MAGISITLAGNFSKLDELKDKARSASNSIKGAFSSNMGKAMFAGIATAGTAAFAGIVASVKSAINAGGELADMMASTGAQGKGLLILQKAFENAGQSASAVTPALNRMQKALAGINEDGEPTNEAFAKLGLSVQDLMGMDPAEAFRKIGEAIATIPNPAQRTATAMAIFGKSGGNLLAVFNDPTAFSGAATQLGSLADLLPKIAGDADYVGDAFGSIDDKIKQVGAGIAEGMMPQLVQLSTWINETDFVSVGSEIGMLAGYVADVSTAIAMTLEQLPGVEKLMAAMAKLGAQNPTAGTALPTPAVEIGADGVARRTDGAAAADQVFGEVIAQADKDPFAEPGDPKMRAQAEREWRADRQAQAKQQESIRQIEEEDAARNKAKTDAITQAAADRKASIQERLAGNVNNAQGRLDDLQYQSSVGSISSMQRIGGGGGAVASGLDYQRQVADLQRETNGYLRELIEVSRQPVE